jgi:hypothetical protein
MMVAIADIQRVMLHVVHVLNTDIGSSLTTLMNNLVSKPNSLLVSSVATKKGKKRARKIIKELTPCSSSSRRLHA